MNYLIHQLLSDEITESIVKGVLEEKASWEDGKTTAGSHAKAVKNNLQLNKSSISAVQNSKKIVQAITSDQLVKSFSLPRKVHGVMFTQSSVGQGYGSHVDNPYMSTGRSDLSFTVFLSEPGSFEGGELCIQTINETKEIKLKKGEIIIYPSTSLHSVNTVTKGKRLVCVGWIQSYVSNNDDRNYLFSLDAGSRGLLAKYGRSNELDLVFQSYSNLLRRLGD
ncbi:MULTISPECIES: Fe2+-dependent dioxygenase [Prochlorococcus]|uniref:Fe2+-dependent dioxygenase n=1 Tax=Prochlorococcus TaxID=1218 RepID=UPI000533B175|nr:MULTISPECIES: Fe2+-dependent dioxygenase [Prochlorococcus]KGG12083.1 Iron-uptake factor PiuC [Prochlorococcus sp. MIT 0601]